MAKSRSTGTKGRTSSNGRSSVGKSGGSSSATASSRSKSTGRPASKQAATSHSSAKGRTAPGRGATASKKSTAKSPIKSMPKNTSRKKGMTSAEGLEKVFKETLKDIYYAEKQLVKALKKMAKAASNEDLREAFTSHREETEGHVEKLEQVFELLDMRAQGKKCMAMDGLISEGSEQIEEFDKGPARDAALIVSAQKVEHYEIAAYGSLKTFAATLGHTDAGELFEEILDEEKNADDKLTDIAGDVNNEAQGDNEDENDEEDETIADDEDGDDEKEEEETIADLGAGDSAAAEGADA